MKKIISLLVAAVMVFAMTSVSFANTTAPTLSVEIVGDTFEVNSTFELHVKYSGVPVSENDEDWAGIGMNYLSFKLEVPGYGTAIKSNGKTWVVDSLGGATKNMQNTTYGYEWNGQVTADSILRVGEGTVAVIKLKVVEELTESVSFNLSQAWIETIEFDAEEKIIGTGKWTNVGEGDVINVVNNATITVESDEPAADTVAMSAAPVFTADAVKSTQDEGWQKGQAVINTFKLGDIKNFINMGWKLSFVDETYADRYATLGEDKFAQIIEDLGSVDDTADVEFVAAFVVNERDAEGNVIDHIIKAVETALYDGSKVFTAVAPAAN